MNYYYALKVLGLDDSFTLEELKRNYKELLKKYHPDNNLNSQEQASEKTSEVINAYNLLKNYVSDKSTKNTKENYSYQNNSNNNYNAELEKVKEEFRQKIKTKYLNETVKYTDPIYVRYMNLQKDLAEAALNCLSIIETRDYLLEYFTGFELNVCSKVKNMVNELAKKLPINNVGLKNRILDLKNSCDNVYDAYYKYNKIIEDFNKISAKLDSIIEKFKNYAFFSKVESKILKEREEILKDQFIFLRKDSNVISEFEKQINSIFKNYEKKLNKDRIKVNNLIEKLKKYKNSISDFESKDSDLKEKCYGLIYLIGEADFEIKYNELNNKINELIKEIEKNKINQNNIFNKLVTAYYSKVSSLNLPGDLLEIKSETDKLNKIIKIFEKIDTFDIEALYLLEKLENVDSSELEKTINMILYGKSINYEEIFFYQYSIPYELALVETIDEENVFYRESDKSDIIKSKTQFFKNDYISLKGLIDESIFVGKPIFIENKYFRSINNPILLCSNGFWDLVVSSDYKDVMILNKIVDYTLGNETVITEIPKEDIYNMVSNIAKSRKPNQDSVKSVLK